MASKNATLSPVVVMTTLLLVLSVLSGCAVVPTSTPTPSQGPATPTPTTAATETPLPTSVAAATETPAATPTPEAVVTRGPTAVPTLAVDCIFTGVGRVRNNSSTRLVDGKYYYIDTGNGSRIYRMESDGTGRTALTTHACMYLNVVGGWVFYVDVTDGQSVYRMKTDGSGKKKIHATPTTGLLAVDGWLFANQGGDGEGDTVYRMRADGSSRTRFCLSGETMYIVGYEGGWLYFVGFGADYDRDFYRIHPNGTSRARLSTEWIENVVVADGFVYFQRRVKASDGALVPEAALQRMKVDGTGTTKLFDGHPEDLHVESGWIYYQNYDVTFGHLCRVELSDAGFTEHELTKGVADSLSFAGEKMFTMAEGKPLYWYNPDMTGGEKLS